MTNATIWENLPRYLFILLVFLLPVWLLPYTVFPLEINKSFLTYVVTIVALLFWLISILQKASFKIPKSSILLGLAALITIYLISSFFSSNTNLSLIGLGHETETLFSLSLLGIALLLAASSFQSESRAMFFYIALFISGLLVFVFQLFRAGFNITILPWNIFGSKITNTIGSWNEFAVFFGFIALTSLVFLELFKLGRFLKSFFLIMFLISLTAVAFVNFTTVWIVLGVFMLVFLVYLFSVFANTNAQINTQDDVRNRKFIRYTVLTLLVVLFFIMARALMGDFVSSLGLSGVEVRPAWQSTWQVVKSSVREKALLGTGPNTFLYDWLRFKPADINSTLFWAHPFQAGIGLLPTFIATTGLLGILAWLAFFSLIVFSGFKVIAYSENETVRGLLIASFIGVLYLWTFIAIYTPGFLIFALAFIVTGVFVGLLCRSGKVKNIELSFINKPKLGFISSLVVVLLMIGSVASFYLLIQKYWAAYSFGQGVIISSNGGNIDDVEKLISRAARFDQQDRYYRALSEIGLLKIQQLISTPNLPPDDATAQFQNWLAYSIQNAQSAVRVNPLDYQNWMSLGQIYEAVVPLKITGSGEAGINAYQEAFKRAPFDPRPLFAAGRVAIQNNDLKSAESFLNSSIVTKGDFAPAVFLLAQLKAQQGDVKEAINKTEQTLYLAPNDVGVIFQLGLLYYQDKNYDRGRLAFEKAISLNPSYSNARYFLGLIYSRTGKNNEAIDQFEKIRELNPDNVEVKKILSNLQTKRPALEGISPPQPLPEKRREAPLDESQTEKELKQPNQ